MSNTPRTPRRQTLRLLIRLLGVPGALACCCLGAPVYNIVRGEQIARALVPPEYPGSTLLQIEQERFPNTRFEHRIYYTSDNLDTVLAYMEHHMPGFTSDSPERYSNHRQDDSLPSLITAFLVQFGDIESGVPGVEINLDEANATGTEITIILSWPDP